VTDSYSRHSDDAALSDDLALGFADDMCAFIDASPSPFHASASAVDRLAADGFVQVHETQPWPSQPGRYMTVRGGSFVAWVVPEAPLADDASFRIAGAHTDSPNLRVKENPDIGAVGWQQVSVDPYGGALVASWMDRDLGLSGRVFTRHGDQLERASGPRRRADPPRSSARHPSRPRRPHERRPARSAAAPHARLGAPDPAHGTASSRPGSAISWGRRTASTRSSAGT